MFRQQRLGNLTAQLGETTAAVNAACQQLLIRMRQQISLPAFQQEVAQLDALILIELTSDDNFWLAFCRHFFPVYQTRLMGLAGGSPHRMGLVTGSSTLEHALAAIGQPLPNPMLIHDMQRAPQPYRPPALAIFPDRQEQAPYLLTPSQGRNGGM